MILAIHIPSRIEEMSDLVAPVIYGNRPRENGIKDFLGDPAGMVCVLKCRDEFELCEAPGAMSQELVFNDTALLPHLSVVSDRLLIKCLDAIGARCQSISGGHAQPLIAFLSEAQPVLTQNS